MKHHSFPVLYSFIHLTGFIKLVVNGEYVTFEGASFKHINSGDINANSSSKAILKATHPVKGYVVELLVVNDTITVTSHNSDSVVENTLSFR